MTTSIYGLDIMVLIYWTQYHVKFIIYLISNTGHRHTPYGLLTLLPQKT